MKNALEVTVINTTEQIRSLVDWLVLHHTAEQLGSLVDHVLRHTPPVPSSPPIYIDLEGVDLCREGSISILTLLSDMGISTRKVYLIDVHVLGAQAFNTSGLLEKTLKDILQDEEIPKVFFDVRNDSDALFAHFGVALQGVEDVQLMESAARRTTASRKFLSGLAKCVEGNVPMSLGEKASWKQVKEKGERLFNPKRGGSYEVFNQRPIPEDILSYCVGDVQYLPELRDAFWKIRAFRWRDLVKEESMKRVSASQKPDYQPHGPNRAMAPWTNDQNRTLDIWNAVPPPRDYFDEDDRWEDDSPTSCRDIIADRDYHYYYSD